MHDTGLQQQTLSSSTKDKLRESRNAATSNQSPKPNLFSGLSTRGFQARLPLKSLSLFSDLPVVAQGAKLIFTTTRNKYDSTVRSGSSSPTTLCYVTLTSASCVRACVRSSYNYHVTCLCPLPIIDGLLICLFWKWLFHFTRCHLSSQRWITLWWSISHDVLWSTQW